MKSTVPTYLLQMLQKECVPTKGVRRYFTLLKIALSCWSFARNSSKCPSDQQSFRSAHLRNHPGWVGPKPSVDVSLPLPSSSHTLQPGARGLLCLHPTPPHDGWRGIRWERARHVKAKALWKEAAAHASPALLGAGWGAVRPQHHSTAWTGNSYLGPSSAGL